MIGGTVEKSCDADADADAEMDGEEDPISILEVEIDGEDVASQVD
jgi:uncharacterized ParB-like nuclease family protein